MGIVEDIRKHQELQKSIVTGFFSGDSTENMIQKAKSGIYKPTPENIKEGIAGQKYGRVNGKMTQTEDLAVRLLRLPLWIGLDKEKLGIVIDCLSEALML